MRLSIQDWGDANQQYLSGLIKLLKERIAFTIPDDSNSGQFDCTDAEESLNNLAASMPALPAVEKLTTALGLTSFEKSILLLCAGLELDAAFSELISSQKESSLLFQPSFGLALAVLPGAHWTALSPGGPLRYWRLIEINRTALITHSPLKIDEHILHYLTGISAMHEKLNDIAEPINATEELVPSQRKTAEAVIHTLERKTADGRIPVVQFFGNDRTDKLNIAAHITAGMQSALYTVPAYALPAGSHEVAELARLWSREAALNNYVLLLDCTHLDTNDKPRLQSITSFIENISGLVILHADQWTPDLRRNKIAFDIERPKPAEQLQLWEIIMGENAALLNGGLGKVVSQFNLSSGTIRKAGFEVMNLLSHNGTGQKTHSGEAEKKLWGLCCRYTRPQVDELAQRIEPVASWNDIVLPTEQKNMLREIAAQVRHRNKVYSDWGFATKGNRGLGISALFAGESGTGKTMAAEVLANELELDLYKIDLSKVVNKYIGETEKNLKKVFDAAEEGGAILLFDEADALFGKRSDVKDSHDRYSNIEVSYLLQRMEAYRGLAILTTNMKNAVDKAFVRRIRFILHFQFPDMLQRAEIWSKVFPQQTPKGELDLEKLSRLSVAGGSIRNIALNAAFIAADESSPVQMSHIFRAAKSEYDKTEKPYTAELKTW